jgi:hypothetical protein
MKTAGVIVRIDIPMEVEGETIEECYTKTREKVMELFKDIGEDMTIHGDIHLYK